MFLFQRFVNGRWRNQLRKRFGGKKGHRRLIVTPTSASSIHIYNHCGSRAILGLHVNGLKKVIFCLLFVSIDEKCYLSLGPTLWTFHL